MKESYRASIAQSLQAVPDGTIAMKQHHPSVHAAQVTAQTTGKGRIETFLVLPGIAVSYHQYLADQVQFQHEPNRFILEINHCHMGRIGWNMRCGAAVYLGPGDLCLHALDCCADSEMTLPLGYYEGIAVTVDCRQLEANRPDILTEAGMEARDFYEKFCANGKPLAIPASTAIDQIFSPLYGLPESLRLPYYKLKAQEALLYLGQMAPEGEAALAQYVSGQTELIREIRDFLVHHLEQRFTIEELSKRYLINTSALKSVFKAVYGLPIASYVKGYRMQQAMQLLRQTDQSIAAIAEQVGYESQGKFTKAFKEHTQLLPTEYRRMYQKSESYSPGKDE